MSREKVNGGSGGRGAIAGTALLCVAAATLAAASLPQAGDAAAVANTAEAITTPGSGTLTMCLDWFLYNSCNTYHHVALPERIAVGDKITVTFGSNPKDYDFHVVAIHHHGERCTILSDHSGAGDKGERIEVARCHPAAKPAAAAR